VEPAGNLKGKFAGWVGALRIVWVFAQVEPATSHGQVRSSQVPASLITGLTPSSPSCCFLSEQSSASLLPHKIFSTPDSFSLFLTLLFLPVIALTPGLVSLHKMESPQDTVNTDHQDDQQAKSSYVAHTLQSIFLPSPQSPSTP
jgi:hypothetical protein